MNGAKSSGNFDLIQVEAALLASESQPVHYSRRTQWGNLPALSGSLTNFTNYSTSRGLVRHRRRSGRLKIKCINVSQTQQVEMTYLERTSVAQPLGNSKRSYGVHRPRR